MKISQLHVVGVFMPPSYAWQHQHSSFLPTALRCVGKGEQCVGVSRSGGSIPA